MDSFPARIAPQIDRLVLGVNRQVGPRHGRVLEAIAIELGLDSLKLIPHFADFLLSGPLRPEIAEARLPYSAPGEVHSRLDRFVQLRLLDDTERGLEATSRFRPLLIASVAAREDVIDSTWKGVSTTEIDSLISRVIEAVPDTYRVAVAHRSLTPASAPLLCFYDHLVTLRYIRQHDHVAAWQSEGASADAMKVLTPLWRREAPPEPGPRWEQLEAAGLVEKGSLTERGRRFRERIEVETNRRSASTWSVLDEGEREELLAALSMMPGEIAPED